MGLLTQWVAYGDQKRYTGYLARQERAETPLPAVIVVQEIWGVDAHIRDVTERFARAGFAAFAPDLYADDGVRPEELSDERIEAFKRFRDRLPPQVWQNEQARNAELDKLPEEEREIIGATHRRLFGGMARHMPAYAEKLAAAARFLREECDASRGSKVGVVGFCMGGALAGQLACRDRELSGAVIFYGDAPQREQLAHIVCPVLGFYGALDGRITAQVPAFSEAMKEFGKSFEYRIYEGAPHAFFNDTRSFYHARASRDAFARTLGFLNECLG
jgi:carboxymethylenebutenolidase